MTFDLERMKKALSGEMVKVASGLTREQMRAALSGSTYWCNIHHRAAINSHGCDPKLGGIACTCSTIKLTEEDKDDQN